MMKSIIGCASAAFKTNHNLPPHDLCFKTLQNEDRNLSATGSCSARDGQSTAKSKEEAVP